MHSKDEFVTVHIGRSTWQGLKSELDPNSENPERIWAYAWTGKEGFQGQWDYFDTSPHYGNVTEYVRADLYDALAKERDELQAEVERLEIGGSLMATNIRILEDELRKAEAEVERLRAVLRGYKEELCEGYCEEDGWADAGHCHPDFQRDCGGCRATCALHRKEGDE